MIASSIIFDIEYNNDSQEEVLGLKHELINLSSITKTQIDFNDIINDDALFIRIKGKLPNRCESSKYINFHRLFIEEFLQKEEEGNILIDFFD